MRKSGPITGGARRRGSTTVETAVVLPVFFILIFGLFEMARMCMVAQLLTDAAREGCRVAVTGGKTQADVNAAVAKVLSAGGIPASKCSPQMSRDITTATLGDQVTVTLTVSCDDVSWLSTPMFFTSASIHSSATLSSERP